jgi:DNA-binding cell septation regulator SpoVG
VVILADSYRIVNGDLVNMTGKKTADSNGQDLLTPLVEKAANAVESAVAKPAH